MVSCDAALARELLLVVFITESEPNDQPEIGKDRYIGTHKALEA